MMKKILVAAAVALALSPVSFAQQAVQWKVSEGGNEHWYQVVTTLLPWQQARQLSEARGGHLVTVTSAAERDLVWSIASPVVSPQPFWIGGYQPVGSCEPGCGWRWVTEEPFAYTNWCWECPNDNTVNGNEDAICVNAKNVWNDLTSNGACAFIIEWSADCNGDGIVDYGQCRDGSLPDYNGNNIPDCCEAGSACVVGNYPVQWRVADGGNGHWYQRNSENERWAQARVTSESAGGHLVTLTTAAEQSFVWSALGLYGAGCFLGAVQQPDSCEPGCGWTWITGEPWNYTNWASFAPDNNTVLGNENRLCTNGAGNWDDFADCVACVDRFVIEWSADCNGDGIVDKGQILRGQLPDIDNNGIPDPCEQPTCRNADLLADRNVNGTDLGILLAQWGPNTQYTISDINSDGVVDGSDLGLLLSFWGPCPY